MPVGCMTFRRKNGERIPNSGNCFGILGARRSVHATHDPNEDESRSARRHRFWKLQFEAVRPCVDNHFPALGESTEENLV